MLTAALVTMVCAAPAPLPRKEKHILPDVLYSFVLGSTDTVIIFHKDGTLTIFSVHGNPCVSGGWTYDKKTRTLKAYEYYNEMPSTDPLRSWRVTFIGEGLKGHILVNEAYSAQVEFIKKGK